MTQVEQVIYFFNRCYLNIPVRFEMRYKNEIGVEETHSFVVIEYYAEDSDGILNINIKSKYVNTTQEFESRLSIAKKLIYHYDPEMTNKFISAFVVRMKQDFVGLVEGLEIVDPVNIQKVKVILRKENNE